MTLISPAVSAMLTRRQLLRLLACLPVAAWAGNDPVRQWPTASPEIPDVVLTDSDGVKHRLPALVADRPVAIGFFYTRCSTVCPLQTAVFQRVQQILFRNGSRGLLLSISLDPVNDTPSSMRAYGEKFKAQLGLEHRWLMLSGDGGALEQVWNAFDNDRGPAESHSSTLWVGSALHRRWMRLNGFTAAAELANWLEASGV